MTQYFTRQPEQRDIQNHLVAECAPETACGRSVEGWPPGHPARHASDVDCRGCQRTRLYREWLAAQSP